MFLSVGHKRIGLGVIRDDFLHLDEVASSETVLKYLTFHAITLLSITFRSSVMRRRPRWPSSTMHKLDKPIIVILVVPSNVLRIWTVVTINICVLLW